MWFGDDGGGVGGGDHAGGFGATKPTGAGVVPNRVHGRRCVDGRSSVECRAYQYIIFMDEGHAMDDDALGT